MQTGRPLILLLTAALFATAGLAAQPPEPPGKRDRCPVCGMFVAPYPEWVATIVLKDDRQIYFDGCKDLFRYYFGLSETQLAEIESIYVTEYYQTRLLPARKVYYVVGSDIYGPMGKELIPVAGKEHAETFMKDHNGTRILTFDQVTAASLPED